MRGNARHVPRLRAMSEAELTWVSICVPPTDTPSSPSIDQVEPYSSTAQVQFDEPEATGGVPILKYKAEWRAAGEEGWHFRWFDAKEGELGRVTIAMIVVSRSPQGMHSALFTHPGSMLGRVPQPARQEPPLLSVRVSALLHLHSHPRVRASSRLTESQRPSSPWGARAWSHAPGRMGPSKPAGGVLGV